MKKLLIKLTPLEPYFLGGNRIHEIDDGNKHYYIHSLDTPSQTTLFGVLRYMAIANPQPNADFKKRYDEYHKKHKNGEFQREYHGFALNRPDIDFGAISISPLYLVDENDQFYIPVPLDHKAGEKCYTSFCLSEKKDAIKTNNGKRRFPTDYDAKIGLASGWLALDGKRTVRNNLFTDAAQVGIDKYHDEQAFFKKEYKLLAKGFSFAFFADVEMELHNHLVYMGQGKSAFRADWCDKAEQPNTTDIISKDMVYAQSDIYIDPGQINNEELSEKQADHQVQSIKNLYSDCEFVCVKTRSHKIFDQSYLDRKGSRDIRLIQAGSVFLPNDIGAFKKKVGNKHAEIAGFNKIIVGGEAQ